MLEIPAWQRGIVEKVPLVKIDLHQGLQLGVESVLGQQTIMRMQTEIMLLQNELKPL